MSGFKVGDRVRVLTNEMTDHHGDIGRISQIFDTEEHPYEVTFQYGDGEEFDAVELELVQMVSGAVPMKAFEELVTAAQDAPTVDAGANEPSAFAMAAQGDDRLAVALYSEAVLTTKVKELEAELTAANQANARLRAALDVAAKGLDSLLDWDWSSENNQADIYHHVNVILEKMLASGHKRGA